MRQILTVIAISALAGAPGLAGCDSNPTPHPQAPDTQQLGQGPETAGEDPGDDLDPDFNSDGGRNNEDDDAGSPAASVDAGPSDAEVAEAGETAEATASTPSGEQNGADPCDGAFESGDDDTDSAAPTTYPGRTNPLEDDDP